MSSSSSARGREVKLTRQLSALGSRENLVQNEQLRDAGTGQILEFSNFQIVVQLILVLVYGQLDAHQPSVPQRRCWIMTETISLFVAFHLDDTTKIRFKHRRQRDSVV